MPGDFSPVVGAQPVEYDVESSYATELADHAAYDWFGITTSWSADQGVESSSITYLPEYGANNKLEKRVNVKLREMYEGEITYHPQGDFSFLQYFTGALEGTADDVDSLQFGEINEGDGTYRRLLGGVGEEITISVAEDEVAEVTGSFTFGEATDWTNTDYVTTSTPVELTSPVTPTTDSSVGVQTDTADTGEVVLFDGSGNELGRGAATTTGYTSVDVGGVDVVSVKLVGTDTALTGVTVSVNPETDGSGTGETATVDSSGEHAQEDTTEPWSYDSLGSVTYGGTEMDGAIDSVELTISNDLAVVRDANSSLSTQIDAILPVDREITVSVEFTYDNFDILNEIRSYTAKDFEFTIGNTTFTVGGVKFPEAPYEFTADDLVADSLDSDPASSISWTTTTA